MGFQIVVVLTVPIECHIVEQMLQTVSAAKDKD